MNLVREPVFQPVPDLRTNGPGRTIRDVARALTRWELDQVRAICVADPDADPREVRAYVAELVDEWLTAALHDRSVRVQLAESAGHAEDP